MNRHERRRSLAQTPPTPPVPAAFEHEVKDGSGQTYTLRVMPRTEFGGSIGAQTGIGISGPLLAMSVGLSDLELEALIDALRDEHSKRLNS